jgi:tetratricopeptide (TPR) repeat protein
MAALAGDPFRPDNPHAIGDRTEAVFNALFYEGNYSKAQSLVEQAIAAEPNEPMNYAIAAALGYLNKDLNELAEQARLTQEAAAALKASDPLRGHLYSAVGTFMEGAHALQTQGVARGTPTALRLLQRVFSELEAAEDIDANDPELSLLKGFMDLLLAVNLPFADPDQAIARLQNGHPDFLVHRGIAIGLRDLGRYSEALTEVDRALAAAPNNPDLLYLKAQILYLHEKPSASLPYYQSALNYADQLPTSTARQIAYEACLAEGVHTDCVERTQVNQP